MKRRLVALLVALACACSAPGAQEAPVAVEPGAAAAALAISGGLQLATVLEAFGYGESWFPYVFLGTAALQQLPPLAYACEGALALGGTQLGLSGLYFLSGLAPETALASPLLFNAAHKLSMFGSYNAYADLRSRARDEAYREGFSRLGFADLALASFEPASYADWPVWGYVGSIALVSAIGIACDDGSQALWTTGSAYLGQKEFSVWAGVALMLALQLPNFVMTGVGEEALYRGSYYEELSYRYGRWPAKIADALYFTLSHFPQQWDEIKAMSAGALAAKMALSVGQAFWLQYVYEWHGLKSAVAAHAATDIIMYFTDWMLHGGVPNERGFSVNERSTLSISFKL